MVVVGTCDGQVDLPDSPVEGIVAASSRSEEASAGAGAGAGAGAEPKEGTTMNLKRLTEAGNPGELLTKAALAAEVRGLGFARPAVGVSPHGCNVLTVVGAEWPGSPQVAFPSTCVLCAGPARLLVIARAPF